MRRAGGMLVLAAWLAAAAAALADEAPARVTAAQLARSGDLVVAELHTAGLPGQKLLQSMRSGLVSSVDVELTVLDAGDDVVGGHQLSLQLAFDLWEEIFSVRDDGREHRFRTLADLQDWLADLTGVPVLPVDRLRPEARYRLRVGLAVHPIAPAQRERMEDAIAGEQEPGREGEDRQEAQVSLGKLIRFFYKGGDRERGSDAYLSPWFTRKELADATD